MPAIFSRRPGKGLGGWGKNPPSFEVMDRVNLHSPTPSTRDAQPLPRVPNKDDLSPLPTSSHSSLNNTLSRFDQPPSHDPLSEFGKVDSRRQAAPSLPAKLDSSRDNANFLTPQQSNTFSGLIRARSKNGLRSSESSRPLSPVSTSGKSLSNSITSTLKNKESHHYGYTLESSEVQLDPAKVCRVLEACGEQLRRRGLDSPLIFSSMALDISPSNVASLIRSYIGSTPAVPDTTGRALPASFVEELQYANPHDLAVMIKWAFAKMGRVLAVPVPSSLPGKKGEVREETVFVQQRGFLDFDLYNAWRDGERRQKYPPNYFEAFLKQLDSSSEQLLSSLFSLLSSTTSYAFKNGMIPAKLAKHFGVLLFGLPEDESFARTYDAFVRASNATEHLFLAYIRSQATVSSLPPRLAEHVSGYPSMLPPELALPSKNAKMVPVTQIERTVRLYSPDLIRTACETDLPVKCPEWEACRHDEEQLGKDPQLSDRFRKLVNLRGVGAQGRGKTLSGTTKGTGDRKEDESVQSHGSLVSKQWSDFSFDGFAAPDESKLAFDLNETARKARKAKRDTVLWSDFSESGFGFGDDGLDNVLSFDESIKQGVERWPGEKEQIMNRLRERQKALPPFRYDTTPRLLSSATSSDGRVDMHPISRMDESFADVWADYMIGAGWSNRDELTHRTANFVVVQYKSRPGAWTVGSQSAGSSLETRFQVSRREEIGVQLPVDPRVDAAWFVIQETVPAQYRMELEAAGRGVGRGKAMIRKLTLFKRKKERSADDAEDDVFRPGPGGHTKHLKLSDPVVSMYGGSYDGRKERERDMMTYSPPTHQRQHVSDETNSGRRSQESGHGQFRSEGSLMHTLRAKSMRVVKGSKRGPSPLPASPVAAPPLPPPKRESDADASFTSDDFETRSVEDSEEEDRRQRSSKKAHGDDAWIDIMLKANDNRMAGQDAIFTGRSARAEPMLRKPVPPPRDESLPIFQPAVPDEEDGIATPTQEEPSYDAPRASTPPPPIHSRPPSTPPKDLTVSRIESPPPTESEPSFDSEPPSTSLDTKKLVESLRAGLSPVEAVRLSKTVSPPRDDPFAKRIDPFAKDRPTGHVASLASKFGGTLPYLKSDDDSIYPSDAASNFSAEENDVLPNLAAREPYQPGMPLDNVMEESESVLSGSNI